MWNCKIVILTELLTACESTHKMKYCWLFSTYFYIFILSIYLSNYCVLFHSFLQNMNIINVPLRQEVKIPFLIVSVEPFKFPQARKNGHKKPPTAWIFKWNPLAKLNIFAAHKFTGKLLKHFALPFQRFFFVLRASGDW